MGLYLGGWGNGHGVPSNVALWWGILGLAGKFLNLCTITVGGVPGVEEAEL